jgi:putative Mn2+ efflux pump MntP
VLTILALAFSLGLDNARTALGLGVLQPSPARQLRIAVVFGLWDTGAPLVGLLIGRWVGALLGSRVDELGPLVLASFGLVLIAQGIGGFRLDPLDDRWILLGLPLSLSLDNMVAGFGLGFLGFSPLLLAITFGLVTASLSFAALQLGGSIARFIPSRPELLAGTVLVTVAVSLLAGWW